MFYIMLITQFQKMLGNLSAHLDKANQYAELKKFDVSVLINSRLAPDQLNLISQVQIACDTAKFAAARLCGKDAPVNSDNETTLAELQNRIKYVQHYLSEFQPDDFIGAEDRKIIQSKEKGTYFTGLDYAVQYSIPNFYFHVTNTYAILRHNGVELGKRDYLGEMPYKQ